MQVERLIRYSHYFKISQFSRVDRHASKSLYYSVGNNGKRKNVKGIEYRGESN